MLFSPVSKTFFLFAAVASSAPTAEDGRAGGLLETRTANKCVVDATYGCARNDVTNCINYLIAAGTQVITVTGSNKVVCALNSCRVVGRTDSGTTSSYARDIGYGVQAAYNTCPGGSGKVNGEGAAGGNGNFNIEFEDKSGCGC